MITDKVKIQLAIFSTLTLIAAGLICFQYVRVPALLGIGQQTISAEFTEGGGIYKYSNVTYRGVTVGKVTGVSLDGDVVKVDMRIDDSADVPADVTATIKSVSAIGEQYVDLVPVDGAAGGDTIESGAVIGVDRTEVPTPIAQVLDDVDGLVSDVPEESLAVVLDEASVAFDDLGPSLSDLVDDAQSLLEEADASYEATSALINNGEDFIDDQLASSDAVASWAADLNGFTAELAENDADVRAILDSVPGAAQQAEATLAETGETLPAVLDSGQILAELGDAYYAPIEELLGLLPILEVDFARSAHVHGGEPGLAFRPNADFNGACGTSWPTTDDPLGPRGSNDLSDMAYPADTYCKVPQDDNRVVRGSRNLQCFEPGSPEGRRAATIQQCRGDGFTPTDDSALVAGAPQLVPDFGVDSFNSLLEGLNTQQSVGKPDRPDGRPAGLESLLGPTLG